MPGVNLDKLRQKAQDIRACCHDLNSCAQVGVQQFLNSRKEIAAAKYFFVVGCEAAFDICNHLVARLAARAPATYAECFDILAREKALSPELAERLKQMAKFRNLLVHRYAQVDDSRVFNTIKQFTRDMEEYLRQLSIFLKVEI
ncbi:MAG: type VII toxin-antitoxin system HepT family RNase toxin [Bacillota bacterium]|uniref:type VII toxin-antitoxin system HepT family RNase toxin n=1 Tax=Desulfurispora thermophila TaxID=265470 RepID=UPI00036B82D5|nr:DUF86 domain-containing protein [Desulfurispora thermophila]